MKNNTEEQSVPFATYRLCRDEQTAQKLSAIDKQYHFENVFNYQNLDYFQFLNKIINECQDDFALVCHDDVVLPLDIKDKVAACVDTANNEFGLKNWGVIGNAGVDFFSGRTVRFLMDPHSIVIPPRTTKPQAVVSIDGNVMLLNIKNLRAKQVSMPEELVGFHLYDFILLAESYAKGLVCAVDSNLFVVHRSSGDQKGFNKEVVSHQFLSYWKKRYINNSIATINGYHNLENNLEYLQKNSSEKRIDFYAKINSVVKNVYKESRKETKCLNIVIRTRLDRKQYLKRALKTIQIATLQYHGTMQVQIVLAINNVAVDNHAQLVEELIEEYQDLNIRPVVCENNASLYPRMNAIKSALDAIVDNDEAYVWFLDDDDFIFPNTLEYFELFLDKNYLLIGSAVVFYEKWNEESSDNFPSISKRKHIISSKNYFNLIAGENQVPICSVIYPLKTLKNIFEVRKLRGDYYEDYALLLFALKNLSVRATTLEFAGISHHDDNTVLQKDRTHWDYSYATYMSEVINSGFMPDFKYEFINDAILNMNSDREYAYLGLKKYVGLLLKAKKTLKKKGVKKTLNYLLLFLKHGRGHFSGGLDSVENSKKDNSKNLK